MNLNILRENQADFIEKVKPTAEKEQHKNEEKRLQFLKAFPIESLDNLDISNYVVGGGRRDSFCYMLETTLKELGNIKGGPTAGSKFGIYFGKTKSDSSMKYRWLTKWGDSQQEAFKNIKKEIVDLVKAGESNDVESMKENKISPMFKGKILATYYPDKFLSIFSDNHLNHYINEFSLSFNNYSKLDPVEKRNLLINELKNKDEVMRKWSVYDFSIFLLTYYYPIKGNEEKIYPKELEQYKTFAYPELYKVKAKENDVEFNKISEDKNEVKVSSKTKYKPDYEKSNKNKRIQGEKAEIYIVKFEKEYLNKHKKEDLATKVMQVSVEDDSLGYDILSYEIDGSEKYIEVKSHTGTLKEIISFFITENELRTAETLSNYWIYFVAQVKTKNPQIVKIKVIEELDKINLTPTQYQAKIGIKKL